MCADRKKVGGKMNLFSEIKKLIKKYPGLIVEEGENIISVKPGTDNGFEVWFSEDEMEYTVGFDGWHQHFEKSEVEDALNCFDFGFSSKCRLKVLSRGGKDYKWILEVYEDGEWVCGSTTGLFNFAFWKKAEIKYLSNVFRNKKMNNKSEKATVKTEGH